ncbi:Myotubularin- protein 3 [Lobosporangium transversale]|nr:Myotubularin- protein 3 [Lobosporangium transversale]
MVLNTAAREQCRTKASPKPTPKLCIMDARAYASAVANGYVGGGRENPEHYPNATISYMSLGNIHVIASAHQALLKAVSTPLDSMNWYTQIESTGWLNHVADLLKAASGRDGIVGRMLEGGSSVLVHCTDGWDRTTQLVSLAQILLDPYYRTINGLRVLIEKEWLSCGHPFQSRTDAVPSTKKPIPEDEPWWQPTTITTTTPGIIHSSPNGAKESISSSWMHPPSSSSPPPISTPSHALWSDMYHPKQASAHAQNLTIPLAPSPVFLLFMTCLHHIVQQHPNRFEYNDYLLVILARAAGGASPFGDFMYNNERERAQDRLRQRTPSIWGWINENRGWFTNNDYYDYTRQSQRERAEGQTIYGHEQSWRDQVLKIQTGGRFTSLWSEYYLNLTPTWFPDPRTVLMNSAFNKECRSKLLSQPLSMWSIYREIVLLRDPWYSSQFDSAQLQQLTFPGLSSIPSQLPQRLQSYQHHQQHLHHQGLQHHQKQKEQQSTAVIMTTMETIPPALALLRGQEMHQYYLLVQHLKKRRKNMVREAFLGWRRWTKLRLEQRVARESGWVVDGVSTYSSSQEEGAFDEDSEAHNGQGGDEEENYGNSGSEMGDQSLINIYKDGSGITGSDKLRQHYSQAQSQRQRRRRTWGQERELSPPRLKVVTAKEGIEVAIGKALEGGAFFGTTGPLIYDPEASSNDGGDADKDGDNVYTEKSSCAGTCRDNNDDAATIDDGFDDMLETFDDLGIPVTPSKAYITTRA